MRIEYARKDDIPQIMEIMRMAIAGIGDKGWYVTDDAPFIERHMGEEGYTLKCVEGDTIAAFLIVRHPAQAKDNLGLYFEKITQEQLNKVAHMESVAVSPAHRGRGLHRMLLRVAEEIEQSRGTEYLMATVHPENVFSFGNFSAEGYECLLETEKYGGLRRKVLYKRCFD